MKIALLLVSLCGAFFFGGCADNSLQTDEEYSASRRPAPFSPDYSNVANQYMGR